MLLKYESQQSEHHGVGVLLGDCGSRPIPLEVLITRFSTPETEAAAGTEERAPEVSVTLRVSIPAPPSSLSRTVKVALVALKVSELTPPVKVSTAVVRVNVEPGVAEVTTIEATAAATSVAVAAEVVMPLRKEAPLAAAVKLYKPDYWLHR